MKNHQKFILASLFSFIIFVSGCSGKEAYLISRTLLGYIPPPEVPNIMAQLEEELERCEKSGGSLCEKQAMEYVRTVNPSLERKPLTGVVVITRVEDGVDAEYFPEAEQQPEPEQQKEQGSKK